MRVSLSRTSITAMPHDAREALVSLPTDQKSIALDKVAEQLESWHSLWLVKLLSPGDRAVLTTCEQILARMRRAQSFTAMKDGGFMTKWLERLRGKYFHRSFTTMPNNKK
eukprot:2939521-Amphidinium_carterae.2